MARFDLFAPKLMKHEADFSKIKRLPKNLSNEELFEYAKTCGWSYYASDKGGATMVGVTLAKYREIFGQRKTADDLRNITFPEWQEVMRWFWEKCGADRIENQSVAEEIVDWCINSGASIIKKVQSLVGAEADGIVGPKTLAAINGQKQKCVHCLVKDARVAYYERIAAITPSQRIFLNGWLNRANDFVFEG